MALVLTSTAFAPNGPIPALHTCQGKDISPPLAWSGAPEGTRELLTIFPAKHFVMPQERLRNALQLIRDELAQRGAEFIEPALRGKPCERWQEIRGQRNAKDALGQFH